VPIHTEGKFGDEAEIFYSMHLRFSIYSIQLLIPLYAVSAFMECKISACIEFLSVYREAKCYSPAYARSAEFDRYATDFIILTVSGEVMKAEVA